MGGLPTPRMFTPVRESPPRMTLSAWAEDRPTRQGASSREWYVTAREPYAQSCQGAPQSATSLVQAPPAATEYDYRLVGELPPSAEHVSALRHAIDGTFRD